MAMSPLRPKAAICLANTTSKPMSLESAVTTATSLVRERAGSGRMAPAGCRKVVATSCASVELPPLPKVSSLRPAAKEAAIASAQAASRSASRSSTSRRSATISPALSTVERRTSSSTASRSAGAAYRNG
jgi:hypothetical protein